MLHFIQPISEEHVPTYLLCVHMFCLQHSMSDRSTLSSLISTGEYFHHPQPALFVSDSTLSPPGILGALREVHACIWLVCTSRCQ